MEDLSLHIIDIVENSVRAEATKISLDIETSIQENLLKIKLTDNGRGMDEEEIKLCDDPFFTTKKCGSTGLGISLLKQSAMEAEGSFKIESEKGRGTTISVSFRYDHIDRKPLGDIAKTFYILIAAFPFVDFFVSYKKGELSFEIDTAEMKKVLEDVPINAPDVLKTLKYYISRGIKSVEKG